MEDLYIKMLQKSIDKQAKKDYFRGGYWTGKLQSIVNNAAHNAQNEDRKNADAFLEKYKDRLDKAHQT